MAAGDAALANDRLLSNGTAALLWKTEERTQAMKVTYALTAKAR